MLAIGRCSRSLLAASTSPVTPFWTRYARPVTRGAPARAAGAEIRRAVARSASRSFTAGKPTFRAVPTGPAQEPAGLLDSDLRSRDERGRLHPRIEAQQGGDRGRERRRD